MRTADLLGQKLAAGKLCEGETEACLTAAIPVLMPAAASSAAFFAFLAAFFLAAFDLAAAFAASTSARSGNALSSMFVPYQAESKDRQYVLLSTMYIVQQDCRTCKAYPTCIIQSWNFRTALLSLGIGKTQRHECHIKFAGSACRSVSWEAPSALAIINGLSNLRRSQTRAPRGT